MSVADHRSVDEHYTRGDLAASILAALRAAGKDPNHLDPADLAPVDQFHTGGRAATLALARLAGVGPGQSVLDVGGGIGGPGRTLAREFGCRVTVADLTAEYCRVGAMLTERTGMVGAVDFVHADALDLPFAAGSFDVVWTQHSSMNIEGKYRLYAELRRVLRPDGRLALYEIMTGPRFPVWFPVPWARDQSLSYLRPPAAIRELLLGLDLAELAWDDVTETTLSAILAPPELGSNPPAPSPLGIHLLLGESCAAMQRNLVRNLMEGRIEIVRAVLERSKGGLSIG